MKLLVLSDLHFEFHRDGGRSFLASIDPRSIDAVLLPGDLTNADGLAEAFALVANHFDAPILYVHGNHEFYGSNRPDVLAATFDAPIEWLDGRVMSLDGIRFLGTPLWFNRDPTADASCLNDFHQIANYETWVYEENAKAIRFLEATLRPGDVVLTHYLPSPRSIHPRYVGSPLNAFFLCDVERLIRDREPALWVHGHTHSSCDYWIGPTHVVCNPLGYAGHEVNPEFDPRKIVEVGPAPEPAKGGGG